MNRAKYKWITPWAKEFINIYIHFDWHTNLYHDNNTNTNTHLNPQKMKKMKTWKEKGDFKMIWDEFTPMSWKIYRKYSIHTILSMKCSQDTKSQNGDIEVICFLVQSGSSRFKNYCKQADYSRWTLCWLHFSTNRALHRSFLLRSIGSCLFIATNFYEDRLLS